MHSNDMDIVQCVRLGTFAFGTGNDFAFAEEWASTLVRREPSPAAAVRRLQRRFVSFEHEKTIKRTSRRGDETNTKIPSVRCLFFFSRSFRLGLSSGSPNEIPSQRSTNGLPETKLISGIGMIYTRSTRRLQFPSILWANLRESSCTARRTRSGERGNSKIAEARNN